MSHAVGWVANINTFGAIHHLAGFVRAHWFAVRSRIIKLLLFLLRYLSHFTSQIAAFGSKQLEWHLGGSQTGVQTASQRGSSHFQEHSG